MTVNERLTKVIDLRLNGNKEVFAESLGMKLTSLYHYIGGRNSKPNSDMLSTICEKFKISPSWLLLGEGNMYRDIASSTTIENPLTFISDDTSNYHKQKNENHAPVTNLIQGDMINPNTQQTSTTQAEAELVLLRMENKSQAQRILDLEEQIKLYKKLLEK
jgi:hypothetical protein